MPKTKIIIGTRSSQLALCQAEWVSEQLRGLTPLPIEITKIKTQGDKLLNASLIKSGDKGLFVKEIEVALQQGEIDLAVHSLKDLPVDIPDDLSIAAVPERVDSHDALISRENCELNKLPPQAVIGTSSLRRKAQILAYRSDLKIVDMRGNLDTRLRKLAEGQFQAIIVAAAGLMRLGWADKITQLLPWKICLPAVGQGALAIEARKDDQSILELIRQLDHQDSHSAVQAERSLLRALGGGCQVPLGALVDIKDDRLSLQGVVISPDGKKLIRDSVTGPVKDAESLGARLAQRLIKQGADKILASLTR